MSTINQQGIDNLDFLNTLRLRPKERRVVQAIAAGAGHARALLDAGYSRSTACKQAARLLNKPRVRRALLEIYYRRGDYLTDAELGVIGKCRP